MYDCETEEVKIGSETFEAMFPPEHSRVKGLIFESIDLNRHDHRPAVRRNWQRIMYVLWKDEEEWEHISHDNADYGWASVGMGLYNVLRGLESDEVKAAIWAKGRISYLKMTIPQYEKDLEDMKKEYSKLTGD